MSILVQKYMYIVLFDSTLGKHYHETKLRTTIIKLTSAIDEIASLTIISYWSYDSLLFTLSKEVRGAIPSELHDMSAGSWADGVLVLSIFVCILALLCTTALKRKDVLS